MSELQPKSKDQDSVFLKRLYSKNKSAIVFDGATGTSFQKLELGPEDFGGVKYEGCNEILNRTRPDVVSQVHQEYLEAGCDVIETNTFGANSIVLSEYELEAEVYELNKLSALIASKIAKEFSTELKPRFVAGSIGPTTKLPTLGHISFTELKSSYLEQAKALIDGSVDLFIIETCQDVLQIKSALCAVLEAMSDKDVKIPIMISVTIETTGAMLIGTDISAVLTILEPFPIDILGLNCATGPEQMKSHIKYLSENSPFAISCIPNAGLPENIGGKAHYRLTPLELRMQLMHFIQDLGVRVIGGCCGTTPEHIAQLSDLVSEIQPNIRPTRMSSDPSTRFSRHNFEPSLASIYCSTTYYQDKSFLIVGERLNASGSKKVRELLNNNDWDALVRIAKQQVNENAHVLDINLDYVGRDGVRDMKELVSRLVTNVNLPLMIDSTESEKMESGLMVSGGKGIINSTNYEDGQERFLRVLNLAKTYGAGIVIGTIDEEGMARTAIKKFEIVRRAYDEAISLGIPPYELFYDPLALPISTGLEEDRRNALETLEAIKLIKSTYPEVHIILGISNVSFGLTPSARIALNSVFLNECIKAGLDSAIVSPSKILPLSKIPDEHRTVCLDLINDARKISKDITEYDPLTSLTTIFEGVKSNNSSSSHSSYNTLSIEKRLVQHIIDGERIELVENLELALKTYKPLEIINNYLLEGMKVVGELFGSGEMQLPFVLQSAQTMKYAVGYLEPYMEKIEGEVISKGKFLIATVKGDVHDIGKNLVDIILSNNGYDVINLGIKQDVDSIIKAQKEHQADCIAMSGLLVKSTAFMKENLHAFNSAGISVPVILGGAALTPKFVHNDCNLVYSGVVIYGKDAFTDLNFMDLYMTNKRSGKWQDISGFTESSYNHKFNINTINDKESLSQNNTVPESPSQLDNLKRSDAVPQEIAITPPFIGTRILNTQHIQLNDLIKFLDKKALFVGQWQMKKSKSMTNKEYDDYLANKAEPVLQTWLDKIKSDSLLEPSAIYGYFPCASEGNSLHIFNDDAVNILGTFDFPRQRAGNRYCIADFYRSIDSNRATDFIPMQAVTMGSKASDYAQQLFKQNNYADYLYFHGLSVQLSEALAEYCHALIRSETGFRDSQGFSLRDVLAQRYRGCRYSFGYPACPNVADNKHQLNWLDAERIGLRMDESQQLFPEQSTTAIVALHSKAKYFSA